MNATITFSTDSSLKAMIEANAAKSSTSVSVYLTDLIKQVFSHNEKAQPRDIRLSGNVRKYMGIVKNADSDWEGVCEERLNEKYGI